MSGPVAVILALVGLLSGALGQSPPPNAQDYVGVAICRDCHKSVLRRFEHTPHHPQLDDPKAPAWRGCEACHGPGRAHAERDGRAPIRTWTRPTRLSGTKAAEANAICLSCHAEDDHVEARALTLPDSEHTCIACHDPHRPDSPNLLRPDRPKAKEP